MRARKKSLKNFRDLSKYDWRLPCPKYFKMGKSSPGKAQSICFFVFTHLLELEKVKRDERFHFREHVCRRASRSPAKCMLHRWASNISICTREQLCVFFREARFFARFDSRRTFEATACCKSLSGDSLGVGTGLYFLFLPKNPFFSTNTCDICRNCKLFPCWCGGVVWYVRY